MLSLSTLKAVQSFETAKPVAELALVIKESVTGVT